MTELAALTARAEALPIPSVGRETTYALLVRDLLTYATTVSQERDRLVGYLAQCYDAAGSFRAPGATDDEVAGHAIDAVQLQAERLATAEQERDAAIASAKAAAAQLGQTLDP